MSEQRILRYQVPIDDRWHAFPATKALHVGCRGPMRFVEFWAFDKVMQMRAFRVFGTGADVPDGAVYEGTVIAAAGQLVWHLFSTPTEEGR